MSADVLNRSVFAQIDAIACDCEKLDEPMLRPLAELLRQELDVMKAACRTLDNAASGQTHDVSTSLLLLRTAINSWRAPRTGEVSSSC